MNQIDQRFSQLGLLTYQFQQKFKKVLLFLEVVDDPELLFYIASFLDIEDLLAILSTCKKLYALKHAPIIEIRILRQKIRYLQSPKQTFNSLALLPAYHQFLSHQKQEEKQIPKNAQVFFKNFKQYRKNVESLKKKRQILVQSYQKGGKIIENRRKYNDILSKLQKQIQDQIKVSLPSSPKQLTKEPFKSSEKPKSFVEKFRQDYEKTKQFQRKRNINHLKQLHKKQSQKVKVVKQIKTPFKSIPVIEIKNNNQINVVRAQSFSQKSGKIFNRVKTILGIYSPQ